MTVVEGGSGKEVADKLGKSIGAVYAARSRVLAKIRKLIRSIEEAESRS
jgi:DNA-directed RNA polymerase specialized sigma24 family protein